MNVTFQVQVQVNSVEWAKTYGIDLGQDCGSFRADVLNDLEGYFANAVNQLEGPVEIVKVDTLAAA
ncbi:MAG: hypothetical protein CL489_03395 [Acidobacteria bacterium]|nr:hypothetical protein [Acidobacteriota bacterium]